MLKAIELIPRNVPSLAAETVPEYKILWPTLEPGLIPETKISGLVFITTIIANYTESAGVPFTAYPERPHERLIFSD